LSLFETASYESASKGIKCLTNHQRLSSSALARRQRCTYGGLVHTSRFCSFSSSGTSIHRKPFFQLLGTMSLLHSALVQVLGQPRASKPLEHTDRLDIKKPESLSGGLGIPPQTCALPGLGLLSLNRLLSLLDV